MDGTIRVILATITGLIGLLGAFVASRAGGGPLQGAGLILAAGAVLFVFFLIKRHFDQAERRGA